MEKEERYAHEIVEELDTALCHLGGADWRAGFIEDYQLKAQIESVSTVLELIKSCHERSLEANATT